MDLITDLLTENRFWTFTSNRTGDSLSVRWNQKSKWSEVKRTVAERLGKEFTYERQVEILKPDMVID